MPTLTNSDPTTDTKLKIFCPQDELMKALTTVSRAVSGKSTLPVLNNILLSAEKVDQAGRLRLVATNLEISIGMLIQAEVEQPGAVTVPARLLTEFVSRLGGGGEAGTGKPTIIKLELDPQSLVLNVRAGRYEANLHGISAQDFPNVPALTEKTAEPLGEAGSRRSELTMLAGDLKEAVGQVVMVASTDESRPVLTGVLANFEGERVTLAAADSFRLAVKVAPLVGAAPNPISIIIPGRALAELGRILADSEHNPVDIEVTANRSRVIVRTDLLTFTSTLIEGNFPNYRQIIPKSYTTRAVMDTVSLAQAVKVAAIFAKGENNNIIHLDFTPPASGAAEDLSGGKLLVTANALETGDNRNELDCTSIDGPGGQLALNSKYLAEALAVIPTGQAALEIQTASNPAVVRPVGQDDYLYVIMPMYTPSR